MLRLILLVLALSAGGTAAYMVKAVQPTEANADSDTGTPVMATVDILVAANDLPAGAALKAEDMRWQVWPVAAANDAFIRYSARPAAATELAGTVLRVPLRAGTPVIEDQVGNTNSGYLSGVLTPGMRAVAIPVSADRTAGGFILPNNRVDVLLALACNASGDCENGVNVRTILQNVRVLAIDQSGDDAQKNAVVGKTATLELSPADAERIIGAEAAGRLSLILRAAQDETIVALDPVRAEATPAPAAPVAVPATTSRTIRVTRGGVSQSYQIE